MANTALCVDQEAGREDVDVPGPARVPLVVEQQGKLHIEQLSEAPDRGFGFLEVYREDPQGAATHEVHETLQAGHLREAGWTPAGPEVDDHQLTMETGDIVGFSEQVGKAQGRRARVLQTGKAFTRRGCAVIEKR